MTAPHGPPDRFATAFDQLHEAAAARIGSSDFGDDDYQVGLRMLLESMDYDPRFSEQGRKGAWGQLVDTLEGRGLARGAMLRNPAFRDAEIRRPIIIVGVPRTGTTALHKLMAVDPQFQGPEKWLLGAPMPRPPRETWGDNPYFVREVEQLVTRFGAMPQQRAAHDLVAEEIDECLWLQRQSFVSNFWTCNWSAGSYDAWWRSQSEAASYAWLKSCLQLIGLNDPDRRWLLKNPSHILHLDQLFATFPDARVIHTHRDPAKAIPSLCEILIQGHPINEVGRVDERARIMGALETSKWARGVSDAEPVRRKHRSQVLDVIHAEFHADPMAVVRRIYDFAGAELSPVVEAAMRERIAAAPERAHGVHHYDVAKFGMTEDEVRERFGDYVDRFDLRPAGARS